MDLEFREWLAGEIGGGAAQDGRYPLTDYLGNTRQTKAPAQLEADVEAIVASALAYRDDAEAAALAATASEAVVAATGLDVENNTAAALDARNGSLQARDQAATHTATSASHRTASRALRDECIALRDECQSLRDEILAGPA